jgi:hypothetical protein
MIFILYLFLNMVTINNDENSNIGLTEQGRIANRIYGLLMIGVSAYLFYQAYRIYKSK